ncbi:ATP-binding protein [Escherichia coli]
MGAEPLSSEQRSDLLEIVDLIYQRGSIIVVSQLQVENWYKIIGDSTHAGCHPQSTGSWQYQGVDSKENQCGKYDLH